MKRLPLRIGWLMVALSGAAFAACAGSESSSEPAEQTSSAVALDALPDEVTFTLPWTDATLRAASNESVADGPSAIAALPNGEVLVLDQLGGKVTLLSHGATPRAVANVVRDARDLAAGPDNGFVAFSPLRATAWFFDAAGKSAGELPVAREIRELTGFDLGPSRRLIARTGYQESFSLGSPSAPVALPAVLAGKREGALLLPDGHGVAVQAKGEDLNLLLLSQATTETRAEVVRELPLPRSATAGRIVGNDGTVVCVRTEHVSSTPVISVDRRAICMDAVSGKVHLDRELPPVGAYLPKTELSVGGGRLVFAHPTSEELTITSSRIGGKGVH